MSSELELLRQCHATATAAAAHLAQSEKHSADREPTVTLLDCAGICQLAVEAKLRGSYAESIILEAAVSVARTLEELLRPMAGDPYLDACINSLKPLSRVHISGAARRSKSKAEIDDSLDEALRETFPASDPIAVRTRR